MTAVHRTDDAQPPRTLGYRFVEGASMQISVRIKSRRDLESEDRRPSDEAECWPDNHGPLSNLPHDA